MSKTDVQSNNAKKEINLNNSSNKVYSRFFAENELVKEWNKNVYIHKSLWRKEESENSFCLKPKDMYRSGIPSLLIECFGIEEENQDHFISKYSEAVSGDGQEWTRITTLHSSSLAALLCFYNVTENNPLQINSYKFTESYFEVKSQVYDTAESNMDVVLRGTDGKGNKVVLFLECKFSEYLNAGKYDGISWEAYHATYNDLNLFSENCIKGLTFEVESKNDNPQSITIRNSQKGTMIYCGGIKQMLSHYMGVSNYATKREDALAEHYSFKADRDEKVLLGTVLFDFKDDNISNASKRLKKYAEAYNSLAKKIKTSENKKEENKRVTMFENILIYQDICKDLVKEENIRKFYGFEEKSK